MQYYLLIIVLFICIATVNLLLSHPIYKELLKLNNKKTKNLIKRWTKDLKGHLIKEDLQIWNDAPHQGIRKMQIKTIRYHSTPISMAKIWNTDDTKYWQGWGVAGTLILCYWECKMVQLPWKTVWKFLTKLDTLNRWSSNHTSWYSPKECETDVHMKTTYGYL